MPRLRPFLPLVLVLALLPSVARAADLSGGDVDDEAAAVAPKEASPRWYGWQTLIVDGAALATAPVGVGFVVYPLGGPTVHAAHGRWGVAAASLGMRVALPVGAVLIVRAFDACDHGDFCGLRSLVIGGAVGAAAAIAIDASLLAWAPASDEGPAAVRAAPASRVTWQPRLAPRLGASRDIDGAEVGVVGSF